MGGAESGGESEGKSEAAATGRRWFADWRVWGTLAITGVCLWLAMRDVPMDEVWAAMGRADLVLLLTGSVPAYIAWAWVRGLRWRYLTESIAPMPRSAMFRASAIGAMANNLLPLRIGEIARSWYLARETGTSAASVLASVAIERVIDVVMLLVLVLIGLAVAGGDSDEAGLLARGALVLLPIGLAPLVGLIVLRVRPALIFGIVRFFARPLPDRIGTGIESVMHRFADGLGALRGGRHLFWILLHSGTIWLILSTIPIIVGIMAFGIDLGSPAETLILSWVVLAVVGVAVALPSAPGFIGPYQLAFKAVLVKLGVDPATAFAVGLLVWFVMWVTLTTLGLVVLRVRHTSLSELTARPERSPNTDPDAT